MSRTPDTDFTGNLYKILEALLGDNLSVPFPKCLLEYLDVIEIKLNKDKTTIYKIVRPSDLYPEVYVPQLWNFNAWMNDFNRRKSIRDRSDFERRERFAFGENVKMVSKAYRLLTDCDPDRSVLISIKLLREKRFQQISAFFEISKLKSAEDMKL